MHAGAVDMYGRIARRLESAQVYLDIYCPCVLALACRHSGFRPIGSTHASFCLSSSLWNYIGTDWSLYTIMRSIYNLGGCSTVLQIYLDIMLLRSRYISI